MHKEFAQNSEDLTVDKLMEMFVSSKTTGTEKPGKLGLKRSNRDDQVSEPYICGFNIAR